MYWRPIRPLNPVLLLTQSFVAILCHKTLKYVQSIPKFMAILLLSESILQYHVHEEDITRFFSYLCRKRYKDYQHQTQFVYKEHWPVHPIRRESCTQRITTSIHSCFIVSKIIKSFSMYIKYISSSFPGIKVFAQLVKASTQASCIVNMFWISLYQ